MNARENLMPNKQRMKKIKILISMMQPPDAILTFKKRTLIIKMIREMFRSFQFSFIEIVIKTMTQFWTGLDINFV